MMLKYPEVTQEVLEIEAAIVNLTAATSSKDTSGVFDAVKEKLQLTNTQETKVVPLQKPRSLFRYAGWAAAIVFATGLVFTMMQKSNLDAEIEVVRAEREALKEQIYQANSDLTAATELLSVIRTKDIISVPLGGQAVSPESYAKVYWDKKTD